MEPNTLAHFKAWAKQLILDNGKPWVVEPFQARILEDIFAGYREVWICVGEGNAKTTLLGGLALYHIHHNLTPSVPIGASSREQAEILYRQAEGFVIRSGLEAKGKNATEGFRCQEGYRRILDQETSGRIQVYASDDRTADGVIPTLALVDELHRHRDLRLYGTWAGKLEKRDGQIVTISTAGEPGSEFEETRARIIKEAKSVEHDGAYIRAEADGVVIHDWAVRDRQDFGDFSEVANANPLKAITKAALKKKRARPTMTDARWQRFVCNVATRMEGDGVKPEEWDVLEDDNPTPPSGTWCCGWLDLAWKIDTTAMGVLYWEDHDRRLVLDVKVIEPPVDEAEIIEGLVDRQRRHSPVGWVYDPNAGGQQMVQLLDKGEHPRQEGIEFDFFPHSQDNAPMSLAARRLDEAIRSRWLRHDGDPVLRRHVLNAVRAPLGGEKFKFDRPKDAKGERRKKFPIDGMTGLLMGHSFAVDEHEGQKEPIAIWGASR